MKLGYQLLTVCWNCLKIFGLYRKIAFQETMGPSTSNFSPNDEPEASHSPLIDGLPDDIALFCLARVPRKYHRVLKCVSKRWRNLVCSEEWRAHRQSHNLSETWIYALCREKNTDQLCCYQLDPSLPRQGCWTLVSGLPSRCLKRKGMAFESVGKRLYLLGGCGWCEDASDEVYCYDVAMHAWSQVASMSTARCYFGCEAVDEKIYAIGGHGLETGDPHSWDTYDTSSNTWESHSDLNIISDIEDSVVMDGKIYVRSGASAIPPHVSMAVLDPTSGRWLEADADMACGWNGPAVVVDGTLYSLDQSSGTKLMMWRTDTREWTAVCRLSSLLTRPPCQMVAIDRNIFIIGKGLSTVIFDVSDVGHPVVRAGSSLPIISSEMQVISCKCVSI